MSKTYKSLMFVGAVAVLSLWVFPVSAQLGTFSNCGPLGIKCGSGNVKDVVGALNMLLAAVLALVTVIAVAAIVVGGIQYITSAGDESKAERGKRTVMYAVIGLIIIGLATVIVAAVQTADSSGLIVAITAFLQAVIALVGIISVAAIVVGGIQYITSGGDESRAEKGKRTVLYAVIGLIIVGLATAIVAAVNSVDSGGLIEAIKAFLQAGLAMVGIVAVAAIVYGGVQYIASGGDEGKAERGKRAVLYAVIGLIIVGLAEAIVLAIGNVDTGGLIGDIQVLLNAFLGLVGIVAVGALIIGGAQYIMASGDERMSDRAKHTIMYAVIGLIVIGLSAAVANFVIMAIQNT